MIEPTTKTDEEQLAEISDIHAELAAFGMYTDLDEDVEEHLTMASDELQMALEELREEDDD